MLAKGLFRVLAVFLVLGLGRFSPVYSVGSISFVAIGSISDFSAENTDVQVGLITLSSTGAASSFSMTFTGLTTPLGHFVRSGGTTTKQGDKNNFTFSVADTQIGVLSASILPPGLPQDYSFSSGPYEVVFDASGNGSAIAREFLLTVSSPAKPSLFGGTFETTIEVTLTED